MIKITRMDIALGVVILLVIGLLLFRPPSTQNTYAEFHSSIWKISNQCIADYYYDNLTEEGIVMSFFSIREDCEAEHLEDTVVKIYDEDGPQESAVKAYKLHGLIIKLGGNANFMDKVILKRIDNDQFVMDITEDMREEQDEVFEDESIIFIPENDI